LQASSRSLRLCKHKVLFDFTSNTTTQETGPQYPLHRPQWEGQLRHKHCVESLRFVVLDEA